MSHDDQDLTPNAGDVGPGVMDATDRTTRERVEGYLIGFGLSIVLTVLSFYVIGTRYIWQPGIPVALVMFAVAQIGVHLVFFLHITTAPDNTNNILALAFGVLIVALVVAGSIWIMYHLNENMMPMGGMMSGGV